MPSQLRSYFINFLFGSYNTMWVKLFLSLSALTVVSSRRVNFYRKDYTYIEQYDSFYKFHWDIDGSDWSSAFLACDEEGAELFYPQTVDEWNVVLKLVNAAKVEPNVTDIFVGIHDNFGINEFLTINGRLISTPIQNVDGTSGKCVTMNMDTGVMRANDCAAETVRPFVCRKLILEDISCPTMDKGYTYVDETKKCYKKHEKTKTWSKALQTCVMEGGHLLVLTSQMEAEVIGKKIFMNENNDIKKCFVGFKKLFPNNEFYTVTGHTLRDSGYENFIENNERIENCQDDCDCCNQYESIGDQNINCGTYCECCNQRIIQRICGVTFFSSGQLKYSNADCETKLPFICEMSVFTADT